MSDSGEFRASESVMTAKEAILEIRQDVKELLKFQSISEAAELPKRVNDLERFRWLIVGAALGAGAGGGSLMGLLIQGVRP